MALVIGRWGTLVAEGVRTVLRDTGVVRWHHGGGDDRDELAVDVFLLRVDGLADCAGEVLEYLLVDTQLLLKHVETGDVGSVEASTRFDLAVEIIDEGAGVAREAGRDGWGTARECP